MIKKLTTLLIITLVTLGLIIPVIGCQPKPAFTATVQMPTPTRNDVFLEMLTTTTMAGVRDYLTIWTDGSFVDLYDKGLRIPMKNNPPIRTTRTGKLTEAELNNLAGLVNACPFDAKGHCEANTKIIDTDAVSVLTITGRSDQFMKATWTITSNFQPFFHLSNPNVPELTDVPVPVRTLYQQLKSIIDNKTTQISEEAINTDISGITVKIEPGPGNTLYNLQGDSSKVLLKEIRVSTGAAEKDYVVWKDPPNKVMTGETILVLNGTVQNKHSTNTHIAMWAKGFDKAGTQVAWTLDAAHIMGQIGLQLDKDQTGEFVIHLNLSEDIDSIQIYANNYSETPP